MAGVNQLLPFANGETPNVIPYDEWNALAARLSGFQSGIASSKQFNYILAQGGAAGYVIGQMVADYTTETATIAATPLYQAFKQAMSAFVGQSDITATGSTTARSLEDRFADIANVKDFGAEPGLDCSSAIIETADSTDGTILFPNGDFVATVTPENCATIFGVLSRVQIDGTLKLNVSSGTHIMTSPVVVSSSVLSGLSIVGEDPVIVSITGQVSVSGSAGNYSVVLAVTNASNISVGDFIHTYAVTGTGTPEVHRGGWEILSVDTENNQITVKNTARCASFPVNTITASESRIIKSVLRFNNCNGFVVKGSCLSYVDNIAVVGNSDDYWSSSNVTGTEKGTHGFLIGAVSVQLNGKLDDANEYGVSLGHVSCGRFVCVNGFDQQGIVVELNGSFYGDFVSSCNNKRRGFYASTAAGIRAKHISANGNFLDGCISDIGGQMYSSSESCAVGNGQRGVSATSSGSIVFDTGIMSYNGTQGGAAGNCGYLQASNAKFEFNDDDGVYAEYNSEAYVVGSSISNNGQHGVHASVTSTIRANNCTIQGNSQHGVRANECSVVLYTGATLNDNAAGDLFLRSNSIVFDTKFLGSDLVGNKVNLTDLGTKNGGQIVATSDGKSFVFAFDASASGSYSPAYRMRSNTDGFTPEVDGTQKLGRAANRWSEVFAVNGTINTSDEREKTSISDADDAIIRAWERVNFKVFQFKDAVVKKGEDYARLHVGVIAQQVIESFESEGVDPFRFGIVCYDEWEDQFEDVEVIDSPEVLDENGNVVTAAVSHVEKRKILEAGSRYGIRYEEAFALECICNRKRIADMQATIEKLVEKVRGI